MAAALRANPILVGPPRVAGRRVDHRHRFAAALARVGGCRVLARLGRWSDREKISLEYTLLPLLASLIEYDRVEPAIALALLRLARSVEFYDCGTPEFAVAIERKAGSDAAALLRELSHRVKNMLAVLQSIATRTLEITSWNRK